VARIIVFITLIDLESQESVCMASVPRGGEKRNKHEEGERVGLRFQESNNI